MAMDHEMRIRTEVELSVHQAIGYVWGLQDGGDADAGDTLTSLDFGHAYGERKHAYLTEQSVFMPNIRDAYKEWKATGTIKL